MSLFFTFMPIDNTVSQVTTDTLPIAPGTYKIAKKIDSLEVKEAQQIQVIQNLASGFDSTKAAFEEIDKAKSVTITKQKDTFKTVRNSRYIVASLSSLIPKKTTQSIIHVSPLPNISYTIQPADSDHVPDVDIVVPEVKPKGMFKRLKFFLKK